MGLSSAERGMVQLKVRDRLWEISEAALCKIHNDASDNSVIVSVRVRSPETLMWRRLWTFPSAECSTIPVFLGCVYNKIRQRVAVFARHRLFLSCLVGHPRGILVLYLLVSAPLVVYCRLCFLCPVVVSPGSSPTNVPSLNVPLCVIFLCHHHLLPDSN